MSTKLKQIAQNIALKEVIINQLFKAVSNAALFSQRDEESGLSYKYYGGTYANSSGVAIEIPNGEIMLNANATNYIQFNIENSQIINDPTEFKTGNVRIAKCVTNSSNITNEFPDEKISILWPEGASTSLSGGGGGGGGGSFNSIFDYRQDSEMAFTIKGGIWFSGGKAVFDTTKTVAEYTNIYEINLDPNSTYRVVYDYAYNTINTLLLNSIDVGPSTKTSKLLYIIKTDDSKISEVHDYRKYNLLVNNSVFVRTLDLTSYDKTYRFDFDFLNELQQTGNKSTVYGTFTTALKNVYPQLSRPSFSLICIIDDAGYSSGDEAEFCTSGDNKNKPWRFNKLSHSYDIFVDDAIYVYNPDTIAWQIIDYNSWQLVIKLELELH